MKGLHDFIIELKEPLNDTFKTEGGVELYAHKDFSVDRLSNRIAKVVGVPIFLDTEIEVGYEVMIEPTILYKQIYQGIKQDYTAYVDKKEKWFKVTPNMVVLYRKDANEDWQGYGENVMLKPIEEKEMPVTSNVLIIPDIVKEKKYKTDRAILLYASTEANERGAQQGDEVLINPMGGVNFWLDGVEHWWIRAKDLWAVAV